MMKNGIEDKIYYFLLDWKDTHINEWIEMKGQQRLCDLKPYDLHKLYEAVKH